MFPWNRRLLCMAYREDSFSIFSKVVASSPYEILKSISKNWITIIKIMALTHFPVLLVAVFGSFVEVFFVIGFSDWGFLSSDVVFLSSTPFSAFFPSRFKYASILGYVARIWRLARTGDNASPEWKHKAANLLKENSFVPEKCTSTPLQNAEIWIRIQ